MFYVLYKCYISHACVLYILYKCILLTHNAYVIYDVYVSYIV